MEKEAKKERQQDNITASALIISFLCAAASIKSFEMGEVAWGVGMGSLTLISTFVTMLSHSDYHMVKRYPDYDP